MAEALRVPQSGGVLVKQVAQDSIGERLGLRGGDRLGIVEGQQLIVGGDIVLRIQGIDVGTKAGMVQALRTLETLKPGEIMRVNVLRDGRVVELQTPWTGQ
jgi:serine protease Do